MPGEDFDKIKVIGKGSYGEVWLSRHKKDKKQYVLKKMNLGKASKRERKAAEQEAKLLSRLKHPNIVSYKDSFETDSGFLFIAMQFCEGGDLYARLKEQRGTSLDERQVVEWFVQIAMALQYMHERNILHRDLKTQNIFLTKSKIIKVGDLGIARVLDNACDMATTLIGTPYYMSPELFSNKPYNHKSDVWALGCCVYEMTTLKHAFNAKDMNSLVYKILKGRMPPMPTQYSQELLVLMRSMLHQDPEKRPSVNRILRDSYIKRNIAIFLEDTKKSSNRRSSASSQASRPSSASSASSTSLSSAAHRKSSNNVDPSLKPKPSRPHVQEQTNSKGDCRPPVKPPSSRRAPVPARRQSLEDVSPKEELKSSVSDAGDTQDTVKAVTAKEVTEEEKEPVPRKRNFLRNQARRRSEQTDENFVEKLEKPERNGKSIPEIQKNSSKFVPERPLPVPKVEDSNGVPQIRNVNQLRPNIRPQSAESSKSSSLSSSKEDNISVGEGETPRSLPNISARERRRQKNPAASSIENPSSAQVKLRRAPERSESDRITKMEKNNQKVAEKPPRVHQRQPSLNDSSSSSDESSRSTDKNLDNTKEKEQKRENKEMNNFISLLDTTLHMNNVAEESDGQEEELIPIEEEDPRKPSNSNPVEQEVKPHESIHKSVSMPSVETLTNTSRLMARIQMLHKDCIKGVGYEKLRRAYEILNKIDEDEVEPKLADLLGENFDEFAGKIWQLKFCEEQLFPS